MEKRHEMRLPMVQFEASAQEIRDALARRARKLKETLAGMPEQDRGRQYITDQIEGLEWRAAHVSEATYVLRESDLVNLGIDGLGEMLPGEMLPACLGCR